MAPSILVLLADDAEAELVARLVAAAGYEVDLTTDPSAALGHLPSSEVRAVVLGMELGQDRGVRVLQDIRALRGGSASSIMPIVSPRSKVRRALNLRASAFIAALSAWVVT